MAHALFIDRLFIADSIYVVFGQKSVGTRVEDATDYVKVENEASAIPSGKQVMAQDGIQVKGEDAVLYVKGQVFRNAFDAVNVLDGGQDFDIELSLLEKMPVVKTKRVVQTTFSNKVYWA